jgi:transcriptional regulator with XRE-family HTH domain
MMLNEDATNYSLQIKADRMRKGYSQAELAKKLGISQQAIAKIENGSTPRPAHAVALIKALGNDSKFAIAYRSTFETGLKDFTVEVDGEDANITLFCLERAQKTATQPCTKAQIAKAIGWVYRMAGIEELVAFGKQYEQAERGSCEPHQDTKEYMVGQWKLK